MATANPDTVRTLTHVIADALLVTHTTYTPAELVSAACTFTLSAMRVVLTHAADPADARAKLSDLLYRMLLQLTDEKPGRVM